MTAEELKQRITVEGIMYILRQMQAYFMAPFARRLLPGAKINGILFDGYSDISVPVNPTRNVELCADKCVTIEFEPNSDARMVMKNDGIYFDDGTGNMYPLLKVNKKDGGGYTVSSIVDIPAAESTNSTNQIGFVTN